MSKRDDPPEIGLKVYLYVALLAVAFMASVYRMLFYRPGTMGFRAVGLIPAVAVAFIYPLAVQMLGPPTSNEGLAVSMWFWKALWLMLMVQFVASKYDASSRHMEDIGLPWCRSEGTLAVMASLLLGIFCRGTGLAVLLGYFASEIQVWLIGYRFRIQARQVGDGEREADELQRFLG